MAAGWWNPPAAGAATEGRAMRSHLGPCNGRPAVHNGGPLSSSRGGSRSNGQANEGEDMELGVI